MIGMEAIGRRNVERLRQRPREDKYIHYQTYEDHTNEYLKGKHILSPDGCSSPWTSTSMYKI